MTTNPTPPGRALTPALKRELVERLLVAWQKTPHQRLGQLIANTLGADGDRLFHAEDDVLIELVEGFAERVGVHD